MNAHGRAGGKTKNKLRIYEHRTSIYIYVQQCTADQITTKPVRKLRAPFSLTHTLSLLYLHSRHATPTNPPTLVRNIHPTESIDNLEPGFRVGVHRAKTGACREHQTRPPAPGLGCHVCVCCRPIYILCYVYSVFVFVDSAGKTVGFIYGSIYLSSSIHRKNTHEKVDLDCTSHDVLVLVLGTRDKLQKCCCDLNLSVLKK